MNELLSTEELSEPEKAARRFAAEKIGQGFTFKLHTYRNSDGKPIYWKIRLKHPSTGKKMIWPMSLSDEGNYILKEPYFVHKKPIYHLDKLNKADHRIIWVVEGEACADTLETHGLLATTSGSSGSATTADWSPLAKHKILLWPDNDAPGFNYTTQIIKELKALDCAIKQVDIKKLALPPGGDCVDWLIENPKVGMKELLELPTIDLNLSSSNATQETYSMNIKELGSSAHAAKSSSLLLKLIANMEFFHDEQHEAYASFYNQDHFETWSLDSIHFKSWLTQCFWEMYDKPISESALQEALAVMRGKALYEGKCHSVFIRVGQYAGKIYLNLANKQWQCIEISTKGWKIINKTPIRFKGIRNMKALPIPQATESIDLLWKYINIEDSDRKLILSWLLNCWLPNANFPVLVLTGLQGSAKSTTQEILRLLIDPSTSNLRSAPKNQDDITIAAANNWLVSYNNLSKLSLQNQDDLCCLATGGGFGKRQLFTTYDEALINIKRPVVLNGIHNMVTAQDLISRSIIIDLPTIYNKNRKSEQEIKESFQQDYPRILGGLLNILSKVLTFIPNIKLNEKPRMADFTLLGTALESIMNWEKGGFLKEYLENQHENMMDALGHSSIASALAKLINANSYFRGNFSELLTILNSSYYKPEFISGWPSSPKGLANALKRDAAALELLGIQCNFSRSRHKKGYIVEIKTK